MVVRRFVYQFFPVFLFLAAPISSQATTRWIVPLGQAQNLLIMQDSAEKEACMLSSPKNVYGQLSQQPTRFVFKSRSSKKVLDSITSNLKSANRALQLAKKRKLNRTQISKLQSRYSKLLKRRADLRKFIKSCSGFKSTTCTANNSAGVCTSLIPTGTGSGGSTLPTGTLEGSGNATGVTGCASETDSENCQLSNASVKDKYVASGDMALAPSSGRTFLLTTKGDDKTYIEVYGSCRNASLADLRREFLIFRFATADTLTGYDFLRSSARVATNDSGTRSAVLINVIGQKGDAPIQGAWLAAFDENCGPIGRPRFLGSNGFYSNADIDISNSGDIAVARMQRSDMPQAAKGGLQLFKIPQTSKELVVGKHLDIGECGSNMLNVHVVMNKTSSFGHVSCQGDWIPGKGPIGNAPIRYRKFSAARGEWIDAAWSDVKGTENGMTPWADSHSIGYRSNLFTVLWLQNSQPRSNDGRYLRMTQLLGTQQLTSDLLDWSSVGGATTTVRSGNYPGFKQRAVQVLPNSAFLLQAHTLNANGVEGLIRLSDSGIAFARVTQLPPGEMKLGELPYGGTGNPVLSALQVASNGDVYVPINGKVLKNPPMGAAFVPVLTDRVQ